MQGLIIVLVVCSIILSSVQSQNIPPSIFSSPPNDITYFTKDEVTGAQLLHCVANGTPPLTYSWTKDGKSLNLNDPTKYSMAKDSGSLTFVSPVTDEGYFQCSASNTFGNALSNVTRVRVIQNGAGSNTVIQQTFAEGGSYSIKCTMSSPSVPAPLYQWQTVKSVQDTNAVNVVLDKRIQMDDNGTLSFAYVKQSDAQGVNIYRCHLQNPLINTVESSVAYTNVTVTPGTPPSTLQTVFSYSWPSVALIGKKVILRCFFSGSDDISITWTKPDGSTPSGGDYVLDAYGKLTINSAKLSDQGTYTCTGTSPSKNKNTQSTIKLVVESIPVFQNLEDGPHDKTATNGSTVTFNCNPYAIPDAVPQWFQNGKPFDANSFPNKKMSLSPDKKVLTISNVCKQGGCSGGSDLMVIQCNASNTHGYAFQNGYLNVYDATLITKAPIDVLYDPKEPANFECAATTDSATTTMLTYSWLLNGQPVYTGDIATNTNILNLDLPSLRDHGRDYIGTWTCNATNTHSWDAASARLYTPEPVVAPASVWWWIPLVVILVFLFALFLILLLCCCMYRNRGEGYPVDDIEKKHGNEPEKELAASGFHDYQRAPLLSRSDVTDGGNIPEKPIKNRRGQGSISSSVGLGDSGDEASLANYSNINPGKFNEEGSFIGQYNPNTRQNLPSQSNA